MPRILTALSAALLAAGCAQESAAPAGALVRGAPPSATSQTPAGGPPLLAARAGHVTKVPASPKGDAPPMPPAKLFSLVKYDAPVGKCNAYMSPDPGDGRKHPAIVWITGGNCNAIDEGSWNPGTPDNDQSASAFRQAGLVMMFPGLRGGNDNPGQKEGFYGEVDDVLAATDYLVKLPYVDSKRVYLGGHSTGGTLVLLVAEASDRYRAVFSFGPVDDVTGYGGQYVYADPRDAEEMRLRSPIHWLAGVKTPTFVIEGARDGNLDSLQSLAKASNNPLLAFIPVARATHFSVLQPVTKLIASKIAKAGDEALTLTEAEVDGAMGRGR